MSPRKILILDGHPDGDPARFVHALAQAYAQAGQAAGHTIRLVQLSAIDFPLVRSPTDWLEGEPPASIAAVQADIVWAEHLVILYPLWLGDVPALLKGLLEQVLRPGYAFEQRSGGLPAKLLKGRSARVVVTMGMPALFYRFVFSAHSLKSLERNILKFVGFAPVDHDLFGEVHDPAERATALAVMRELGKRGD